MDDKARTYGPSRPSTANLGDRYNYTNYSSYLNDEPMPDAASEKEQGNEYFKQKRFVEAIVCYSRSIGLSPTAVAFANRAMSYLKLRRFEEAENDCTEALNLDDRYVKAYSRRITARKELGKLKEAMDDAEFDVSIDPNNPELRKQYFEIKALHIEKMAKRTSVPAKRTVSEYDKAGDKRDSTSHPPSGSKKGPDLQIYSGDILGEMKTFQRRREKSKANHLKPVVISGWGYPWNKQYGSAMFSRELFGAS